MSEQREQESAEVVQVVEGDDEENESCTPLNGDTSDTKKRKGDEGDDDEDEEEDEHDDDDEGAEEDDEDDEGDEEDEYNEEDDEGDEDDDDDEDDDKDDDDEKDDDDDMDGDDDGKDDDDEDEDEDEDDDDEDEDDDDEDEEDDDEQEKEEDDNDERDSHNDGADEDPYMLKDATYIQKNELWRNRQRVLIVRSPLKKKNCKSFVENLKLLLPHHKTESKWNKKAKKSDLCDISYSRNCNNIIFFDIKKKRYCLWICKNKTGPSLYFEILDYIPLHSLLFSGNCLLYSRPLLIFSKAFDELEHLKLIKEVFIQVFGTPNYHPLSKPFYDHCYSFVHVNNLIYFRHYQIMPITLADSNNVNKQKLVEIGPKFTLHIIRIFEECFKGRVLYENVKYKNYVSPQQMRMQKNAHKKMNNLKKKKNMSKRVKFIRTPIKMDIDF
ncbi:hypothetical protein AK88_01138 [Plasmodium fragile]|uniref:Brix domain-containing protein n=1 Tax=Plasmodium fragile TaxID=5857 RepID=A0A0D9QQ90_PLAFR|nr:uncharacterized protein AK88_01138 [Plasmodium fragile]KJP89260.1 hypothetical protein AK88_01138 [Plasmodium fragile]